MSTNKNKIIYMGPLYDFREEDKILKQGKGVVQNAPNVFQWNLLKGLIPFCKGSLSCINVLPLGTWPFSNTKLVLEHREWSYNGVPFYEVGAINLPFLKQWTRARLVSKKLKKILASGDEVLIYSAYLPFLKAAYKLPKTIGITLIVTDLPEYYDLGTSSAIRKILRKINNTLVYRYINRVDRFVLLTEQMKEPLKVGTRPYTVVEGICTGKLPPVTRKESTTKAILYTGGLQYEYGIGTLLEAFSQVKDPDAELWLCGKGDVEPEIKERAQKDKRIRYMGFLPLNEVAKLREKAAIMINPRPNDKDFTKYSFPSKTMEYMLSGKPVIMYQLDGVPGEYEKYVYYVKDYGVEPLRDTMQYVLDLSAEERNAFGMQGAQFVSKEKNPEIQARKILNLISTTNSDFNINVRK